MRGEEIACQNISGQYLINTVDILTDSADIFTETADILKILLDTKFRKCQPIRGEIFKYRFRIGMHQCVVPVQTDTKLVRIGCYFAP